MLAYFYLNVISSPYATRNIKELVPNGLFGSLEREESSGEESRGE